MPSKPKLFTSESSSAMSPFSPLWWRRVLWKVLQCLKSDSVGEVGNSESAEILGHGLAASCSELWHSGKLTSVTLAQRGKCSRLYVENVTG